MKSILRLASFVLAAILVTTSAFGQSASGSGSFSLQGRLTATNGTPIPDALHSLIVNVYQTGTTTPIFRDTASLTTTGGIFNTLIGPGAGSNKLVMNASGKYEVGISLDGAAEMQPHVAIASSPRAIAASAADTAGVALSLGAGLIDSGVVSSLNGLKGPLNIMGGGSLAVTTTGNNIALSFSGSGSGLSLPYKSLLPLSTGPLFSLTNTSTGSAAYFSNTGGGPALSLWDSIGSAISAYGKGANATIDVTNAGNGAAINALSTLGSAITATTNSTSSPAIALRSTASSGAVEMLQALDHSNIPVFDLSNSGLKIMTPSANAVLMLQNTSSLGGNLISAVDMNNNSIFTLGSTGTATLRNTTLNLTDSTGTALTAAAMVTAGPVVQLRNMSMASGAVLLNAKDSLNNSILNVAVNGATTIRSSASTALDVATSATGGTAAKISGGLTLVGPAGSGTIPIGALTTTINNAYATATSIIIITINGTGSAQGIRLGSQSNGSFVVSLVGNTPLVTALGFNYLIINTQ